MRDSNGRIARGTKLGLSRAHAAALARHGLIDVTLAGSRVARAFLMIVTFGSLRPDVVTALKPDA